VTGLWLPGGEGCWELVDLWSARAFFAGLAVALMGVLSARRFRLAQASLSAHKDCRSDAYTAAARRVTYTYTVTTTPRATSSPFRP